MTITPNPAAGFLADFVREAGRLPRQSGAPDDRERKAGNALRAFRRRLASGQLDPALRAWLDETIPGWEKENTRPAACGMRGVRRFEARVRAVQRFQLKWGRLPSASGTEPGEAALGVFLRNHRQAACGRGTTSWNPRKDALLGRMVPGWDLRPTRELAMCG